MVRWLVVKVGLVEVVRLIVVVVVEIVWLIVEIVRRSVEVVRLSIGMTRRQRNVRRWWSELVPIEVAAAIQIRLMIAIEVVVEIVSVVHVQQRRPVMVVVDQARVVRRPRCRRMWRRCAVRVRSEVCARPFTVETSTIVVEVVVIWPDVAVASDHSQKAIVGHGRVRKRPRHATGWRADHARRSRMVRVVVVERS